MKSVYDNKICIAYFDSICGSQLKSVRVNSFWDYSGQVYSISTDILDYVIYWCDRSYNVEFFSR